MSTNIIIDPSVNIFYSGFYIEGFYQLFGKKSVKFNSKPFEKLSLETRMAAFPFVLKEGNGKQTKYVIYFNDFYEINNDLYEWCDVYGSVNANFALVEAKYHQKLVSLAPSFGIRCWSAPQTAYYAFTNLLKTKISAKSVSFNVRNFLGKYKRMYSLRMPYTAYRTHAPHTESAPYVFHLSTLWYNDDWNRNDEGVNKTRANFIRACKFIPQLLFEGGMVSQGKRSSEDLFKDCLYNGVIPMETWLEKTKKSALVFNTPAFWSCHGWKLGEYLALGKAIISTQLSNDLPTPLVHGENIHIVEDNESKIKEAVLLLIENDEYREKLEQGAKSYWEKFGTPVKSLELLGIK